MEDGESSSHHRDSAVVPRRTRFRCRASATVAAVVALACLELALSLAPAPPASAAMPAWQLPFEEGQTWKANGPHSNTGNVGVRNSIDFGPENTGTNGRVVAVAAGTVRFINDCLMTVTHADGWETRYTHLSNQQSGLNGKKVTAGTYLGKAGIYACPGDSGSANHVHLSVWRDGSPVAVDGMRFGKYKVEAGASPYLGRWQSPDGSWRSVASTGYMTVALKSTTAATTPPKFTDASPSLELVLGKAYTYTFRASGVPRPTYSRSSGTLPPGIILSSNGLFSGTPKSPGTYRFAVRASNSAGSASVVRTVVIKRNLPSSRSLVSDGIMFIHALGSDGQWYYRFRSESTDSWNENWTSRGMPPGVTLTGTPTAVVSDGIMFIHALGSDGQWYYRFRSESTDSWNENWTSRGMPPGVTLTGTPTAVVSDGIMFIHALGSDGQWYYRFRSESTDSWNENWTSRGMPPGVTLTGTPTAVVSDGIMFIHALGSDGQWYYRFRSESTDSWNENWTSRGMPPGVTLTGTPTAVVSDGIMFIHALGSDGQWYYRFRSESTDSWNENWTSRGMPPGVTLTGTPTAVVSDGIMFIHALGSDGQWYYRFRSESTDSWNENWTSRGMPPGVTLTGTPTAVVSDGIMFIHALGSDGQWYYRFRSESTDSWNENWTSRGMPPGVTLTG